MTNTGRVTMQAGDVPTHADELAGRMFFGKSRTTPKGRFVRADRWDAGRRVDVTFERPNAHGPLDVMTFRSGTTVHFAAE